MGVSQPRPGAGVVQVMPVRIREEADVVIARQRARQIASLAGFGRQDQVRIATAVSEVARSAFQQAGGGRVEFGLAVAQRRQALSVHISYDGSGIPNAGLRRPPQAALDSLIGIRRLMDTFEIESAPGEATGIRFSKMLPAAARPLDSPAIAALAAQLARERVSAAQEVQMEKGDLLDTLALLESHDAEFERQQAEIGRLNAELEETNRGVVALYAELDEKAVALRNADELKGKFLRHVSHEFRTPLNSILALTQLLLRHTDGPLTSEQERQVGYIRRAIQDLTDLVNDLLDIAKVEAGKTEVRLSRINLAQLFGTLRGLMRPLVSSDGVTLAFDDPPDDLSFESDESKISQIMRNLISNALKFTEQGEVRISYGLTPGWLELSVSDTGIGIALEDQERIFQEFTQIHSQIQGRVKGTGLGLPLSRKLAALVGGELTLISRTGEGSTFTLRIKTAADVQTVRQETAPAPDTIRVIDDDEAARYLVRQHFRGTHYRLIEAAGGIEGAERARFERPALIFLDLAMPDRSGFDVLDELKKDPGTQLIPVIIHTSRTLSESDFDHLANRHSAILPKGEFWPAEVMDYIKRLLGEEYLFAGEYAAGPSP
jgi:signal transduction histidine kinase